MKAAMLILVLLLLPACSISSRHSTTEVEVTRVIELPPGTVFSIGLLDGDKAESAVTIPEGHPHAGTYTTTSPHLHEPLRQAMLMMGQPGAESSIEVDEEGVIQLVSNGVTKQ